jgi:anti-sigma B factor antagonist
LPLRFVGNTLSCMDEFRIEVAAGQAKGVRIMKLVGPFTLKNVFEFQTMVREDSSPVTIVDLTDAPYMDSAALGSLLGLHVSCHKDGRRYGLVGVSPRMETLFRVAGVDGLLISFQSVADAEQGMSQTN